MIYFLIYLFLEVMVSSSISAILGGFLTFIELLASAVFGIVLLNNFKYSLREKIYELKYGQITQEEFLASSISKAIGAVLLIVPGFFTDIVGVLLQFNILVFIFGLIFKFKSNQNNNIYNTTAKTKERYKTKRSDDDIIDVEIVDNSKHID